LRHLGEKKLKERLPQIYEMAEMYLGVDAAKECIPVLPAVHYTMGGILAGRNTSATIKGLYSVGECSSVGIHGANRLGSNSLSELVVFGKVAGAEAARYASQTDYANTDILQRMAGEQQAVAIAIRESRGNERVAVLRTEMAKTMEDGCGIYRTAAEMQATCDKIAELRQRYKDLHLDDHSSAWNTEWLLAIELGYQLDVAEAMVHSAINRKESRGSHQRLDGFEERDDENYLKHSLAYYAGEDAPRIEYREVTITKSQPAVRAYGALGEEAERNRAAAKGDR
ncbi:MAG: FAD-binding protein, partial [Pseudomonadales bacterium]